MLLAALQLVEWSRSLGRKLRVVLSFFFSFYFLLLKITVHEHQNEQKDVSIFLSFFLSFKYLLHTRAREKNKMAEQIACK